MQHISICPISVDYFDDTLHGRPLEISDSILLEDISEIFEETAFDAYVPKDHSEPEVESLKQMRYALTHRFECTHQDEPLQENRSEQLLYKLYLGLKVVRPTAGRFEVLHYNTSEPAPRLPRWERNTRETIVCDCESLNRIRLVDLQELAALGPSLLCALSIFRNPIAQAVQSLEVGYRADFLNVRHLLWTIGLDALFTSTEWENRGKQVAVSRIKDFLGPNLPIHCGIVSPDSALPEPAPTSLGVILDHIYDLRNDFAHGSWPETNWAGKVCRRSADGIREIDYAEFLSECASATLRAALKKVLTDGDFVDMFNDKAKMNAHFASRGLIPTKRK